MEDQAAAVYAAEQRWRIKTHKAQARFGDWNEVWPFYFKVADICQTAGIDVEAPNVKPRKGALMAHYDPATQTVFIPPYDIGGVWALNAGVALHEFAHHLCPSSGHGPEFRETMVSLVSLLGWGSDLLVECYANLGLTTSERGDGITDKVNKLLIHADGASTDEERRVYLEKAEGLAATHSINLALLRKKQADKLGERDRPITGEVFSLGALPNTTYRNLAVQLAGGIARAHTVECSVYGKSLSMTFMGYPEDVVLTQLMTTRITPMMFEESDRYLKSQQHKESGVASVSARIAFCYSFAREIESRLSEAVREVYVEMDEKEPGAELVAIEKAAEVYDYVAREFKRMGVKGSWKGSRTSNWDQGAASAGKQSAQEANIYGRKEL